MYVSFYILIQIMFETQRTDSIRRITKFSSFIRQYGLQHWQYLWQQPARTTATAARTAADWECL